MVPDLLHHYGSYTLFRLSLITLLGCEDRYPDCDALRDMCKKAESFLRDLGVCDKTCGFCGEFLIIWYYYNIMVVVVVIEKVWCGLYKDNTQITFSTSYIRICQPKATLFLGLCFLYIFLWYSDRYSQCIVYLLTLFT